MAREKSFVLPQASAPAPVVAPPVAASGVMEESALYPRPPVPSGPTADSVASVKQRKAAEQAALVDTIRERLNKGFPIEESLLNGIAGRLAANK